ncbi:Mitogen-activated protein kinase kinase kinase 4 [Portunus trituberculatus]|uniref:Mitogen-activated protein kinase kinase kinase 4 n=1 Tax=Portunus trituberculatus TaxID=210409 RepID=A0A5B7CV40_PORTR|nr:Mitogen-activated protein kinase kinase kinase 4 [Portunus trituberculatus]
MLCSVGDFIDTGIDDQMAAMQDSTLGNLDDAEEDEDLEQDEIQKKRLLQRCRALQVLLAETRERSLRAAGLAKMLRKDLEVAAEFSLCEEPELVLTRLQLTGHVKYHKEVTRLVTGQHRAEVAPMLVNLARMWMKFVKAHYSQGRGCRPRWANAGLEFIVFVCNPHNTCYLQEQDFQELVKEIECCRDYIIGTVPEPKQPCTPLTPVLPRHFRSSSTSSIVHHAPERSLSTQSSSSQGDCSPVINPTDSPLLRRHLMRRSQPNAEKLVDVTDSPSQYSSGKASPASASSQ